MSKTRATATPVPLQLFFLSGIGNRRSRPDDETEAGGIFGGRSASIAACVTCVILPIRSLRRDESCCGLLIDNSAGKSAAR